MRVFVTRANRKPWAALSAMGFVLAIVALTGGSSRFDTPSLLVLRPLLVIAVAAMTLLPAGHVSAVRWPSVLLGALALVIASQLVPLPPALWILLPHRERYTAAAVLAGQPQPWRPLSIVPMLTLNSLLALLSAAAILVSIGRLKFRQQRLTIPAVLIVATVSAVISSLQVSGVTAGWVYFYQSMLPGLPAGLFANRNHQAAFLAGSLPFFAWWALSKNVEVGRLHRNIVPSTLRYVIAGAGAMLAVLVVLASGSRSGLLLMAVNALGAIYVVLTLASFRRSRQWLMVVAAILGAFLLITLLAISFGRSTGFERFLELREPGAEMRITAWPTVKYLTTAYLPWGSGFGTFDPLFRMYEPDRILSPTYFNQAHNDFLELIITGGVPAIIVLLAFLGWFGRRVFGLIAAPDRRSSDQVAGQIGAMLLATFLLASFSDYPLRTPLASALAAMAVGLLERSATANKARKAPLVRDGSDG